MWNKYTHNPVSLQSRGVELADQWDSGNKSFVVDEIQVTSETKRCSGGLDDCCSARNSWRKTTDFIEMMDRTL